MKFMLTYAAIVAIILLTRWVLGRLEVRAYEGERWRP